MGCFLTTRKEAANLREFSLIFCGARKIRADWRGLADSILAFWRADKDFGLRDQLQRAAVSVMANIAEGFGCESNIEFVRFLVIARRPAVEVQSLSYAAWDIGHTPRRYLPGLLCSGR
jgi:four helix bundle protein